MTTVTLSVPDISCGHCKSSIESAVGPLEGVDRAEVTIDDRVVDITFDEASIDLDSIVAAIEGLRDTTSPADPEADPVHAPHRLACAGLDFTT